MKLSIGASLSTKCRRKSFEIAGLAIQSGSRTASAGADVDGQSGEHVWSSNVRYLTVSEGVPKEETLKQWYMQRRLSNG